MDVRYWDASALVSLCVAEDNSELLRDLARGDGVLTWSLSRVEIASAIERRAREGALAPPARARALERLMLLAGAWTEIAALDAVRDRACRLLALHPLRAADALQLGAALVAVSERPTGHEFVCCDCELAEAAGREGFSLLPD